MKEKEAESDSSDSSDDEPLSKRLQVRATLKEAKTPKTAAKAKGLKGLQLP